jgi:hypothetical protein
MAQIQERKDRLIDTNSTIEARRIRERGRIEQQLFEAENPYDTWAENALMIAQRDAESIGQLQGSDAWRQKELVNNKFNIETSTLSAETRATVQLGKESVALAQDDYQTTVSKHGVDSEQAKVAKQTATDAFTAAGMSEDAQGMLFGKMDEVGANVYAKSSIESIKPMIKTVLLSGESFLAEGKITKDDRRAAYKMVENQLNALVEDGVITKEQAFDAETDLNNKVDNYAEEFSKREKAGVEQNILDTYEKSFVPHMKNGTLTVDIISESDIPANKKAGWNKILQGTYDDTPPDTTGKEGREQLDRVVGMYNADIINKQTAIEEISKLRYIEKAITDYDAGSSIERLDLDYPKDLNNNLQTVLSSMRGETDAPEGLYVNTDRFWTGKKKDEARYTTTSRALTEWVDRQVKDGKVPTAKEIYGMASQFNLKQHPLTGVGSIVTIGGREYEVVGFDSDGEPLAELIR